MTIFNVSCFFCRKEIEERFFTHDNFVMVLNSASAAWVALVPFRYNPSRIVYLILFVVFLPNAEKVNRLALDGFLESL